MGSQRVEFSGGQTYWIHTDHLASTRTITSYQGYVAYDYDYLPFGEQLLGGNWTTHLFAGYERDYESTLDYANARYYSSSIGQFMSVDPAEGDTAHPQTYNRYTYVTNDPLNLYDPTGMESTEAILQEEGDWFQPLAWPGSFDKVWQSSGGADTRATNGNASGNCMIEGLSGSCALANQLTGTGAAVQCPNNICSGFVNGQFAQFTAGAGGAEAYLTLSAWSQGVNEWNGRFYNNSEFETEIIEPGQEAQRWNLAQAIADKTGQDVTIVYQELNAETTVGGNTDFSTGNLNLSFLNGQLQNRAGRIHMHPDGLVHLDNYNPFSRFPVGALGHLFVDVIMGNINSRVPIP